MLLRGGQQATSTHLSRPGSRALFSLGVARSMAISLPLSTWVWLITNSTAAQASGSSTSQQQQHHSARHSGYTHGRPWLQPSSWLEARSRLPCRAQKLTRLWAAVSDEANASVALL